MCWDWNTGPLSHFSHSWMQNGTRKFSHTHRGMVHVNVVADTQTDRLTTDRLSDRASGICWTEADCFRSTEVTRSLKSCMDSSIRWHLDSISWRVASKHCSTSPMQKSALCWTAANSSLEANLFKENCKPLTFASTLRICICMWAVSCFNLSNWDCCACVNWSKSRLYSCRADRNLSSISQMISRRLAWNKTSCLRRITVKSWQTGAPPTELLSAGWFTCEPDDADAANATIPWLWDKTPLFGRGDERDDPLSEPSDDESGDSPAGATRRDTSLTAESTNETCRRAESAVWVSAASFTVVDTDDGVWDETTGGTNQAQCFCLWNLYKLQCHLSRNHQDPQ